MEHILGSLFVSCEQVVTVEVGLLSFIQGNSATFYMTTPS